MAFRPETVGPVYVCTFDRIAVGLGQAQDLFDITTPNIAQGQAGATRVEIREIELSQNLNSGSSIGDLMALEIMRGHTTAGSGGAAATPRNINPKSTRVAASTIATNNTTLASGGTPVFVRATGFSLAGGYRFYPGFRGERLLINLNQRLVVRLPVGPSAAITLSGSIVFEEIGIAAS